jgi:membrane carboxypeptidase/penicillin-binding protein
METALAEASTSVIPEPEGLVTVLISPETGLLASASRTDAVFETFRVGMVPEAELEEEDFLVDPFADPSQEEVVEEEDLF